MILTFQVYGIFERHGSLSIKRMLSLVAWALGVGFIGFHVWGSVNSLTHLFVKYLNLYYEITRVHH